MYRLIKLYSVSIYHCNSNTKCSPSNTSYNNSVMLITHRHELFVDKSGKKEAGYKNGWLVISQGCVLAFTIVLQRIVVSFIIPAQRRSSCTWQFINLENYNIYRALARFWIPIRAAKVMAKKNWKFKLWVKKLYKIKIMTRLIFVVK